MSSPKGAKEGPNEKNAPVKSAEFKLNEDMQEFLKIIEAVTGKSPNLADPEDQKRFTVEYNKWVTAGRKKPALPVNTEELPIPMKLYRVKVAGVQMLAWRDTKAVWHETDKEGNKGSRTKILTKFTKPEAQKLVDDAEKRCHNPTYYFEVSGRKVSVSAADFVEAEFDSKIATSGRK